MGPRHTDTEVVPIVAVEEEEDGAAVVTAAVVGQPAGANKDGDATLRLLL
jgi:hypothetical protein